MLLKLQKYKKNDLILQAVFKILKIKFFYAVPCCYETVMNSVLCVTCSKYGICFRAFPTINQYADVRRALKFFLRNMQCFICITFLHKQRPNRQCHSGSLSVNRRLEVCSAVFISYPDAGY